MKINVPGLWFMSWYDVSTGPNLATYNHVRRTADAAVANQQYAVIAPTLHCSFKGDGEHHRRRTERRRRAVRLRRAHLWLVRLPERHEQRAARYDAEGPLLTMGSNKW